MIIKSADSKDHQIAELKSLLDTPSVPQQSKSRIDKELRSLCAGIKGERESAYDIDFFSGTHESRVVIHDLRIELNSRVAQIDHIIMTRLLEVFVLETKHFAQGVSINEQGEFVSWFGGKPYGIPSPLEQNERHIAVLQQVFKTLKMPTRLGIRLNPRIESLVLVSKNARIDRPKKFDSSRVLKSDQLESWIEEHHSSVTLSGLADVARIVSAETVQDIARQLIDLHRPIQFNFQSRFGITNEMLRPQAARPVNTGIEPVNQESAPDATPEKNETGKLTTSLLAKKLGKTTQELIDCLVIAGLFELREGKPYLTPAGKKAGGEFRTSKKKIPYFLWPSEFQLDEEHPA